MIAPFFTAGEIRTIIHDFKHLTEHPEAHQIEIRYKYWTTAPVTENPIYHYENGIASVDFIRINYKCVHQVVNETDSDILEFRIAKVGDSIFYLFGNVDLSMPDGEHSSVIESLVITDEVGVEWNVNIKQTQNALKYFRMLIGSRDYATIIIAELMRNER
jgi:hypothetical protein